MVRRDDYIYSKLAFSHSRVSPRESAACQASIPNWNRRMGGLEDTPGGRGGWQNGIDGLELCLDSVIARIIIRHAPDVLEHLELVISTSKKKKPKKQKKLSKWKNKTIIPKITKK